MFIITVSIISSGIIFYFISTIKPLPQPICFIFFLILLPNPVMKRGSELAAAWYLVTG